MAGYRRARYGQWENGSNDEQATTLTSRSPPLPYVYDMTNNSHHRATVSPGRRRLGLTTSKIRL
jgi:hypothetical protein